MNLTATQTLPQQRFDIELNEKIQFKQPWKIGVEYTKQLKIKNIGRDILTVKYSLPTQKNVFLLPIPVDFKLSTGVSKIIEVKFIPKEMKNYEDNIEFKTSRGILYVPLYALLPSTIVVFERREINFGIVPTKEMSEEVVVVRNMGEQSISLLTQALHPFSITPSQVDSLVPNEKVELRFSVCCSEAGSFQSTAICTVSDKKGNIFTKQPIELVVNSKYPFITIDQSLLDFSAVDLGSISYKSIIIQNKSNVKANFSIKGPTHSPFCISPSDGLLASNSRQEVVVSYKPFETDKLNIAEFQIVSTGGRRLPVTVCGTGLAPKIYFKQTLLDFGNVRIGSFVRKSLDIVNDSQISVHFVLDNEDKFVSLNPRVAVVHPNSTVSIAVTFSPSVPIPFAKRIFVKLSHHNFVPFVDILGSGFNDICQPYVLNSSHILLYNKSLFGDVNIRPEASMKWYFESSWPNQTHNPISIDKNHLPFGSITKLKTTEYQIVKVQNNSKVPMTCFALANNSDIKANYSVIPERMDIAPGKAADFKVGVKPLQGEIFFSSTVEFITTDTRLLNYNSLVEDIMLPSIQSVHINGNSFGEVGNAAAKFQFIPEKIMFNDCIVGDIQYQCIVLENQSDIPMPFSFDIGNLYPIFQCRPSVGCIKPKSIEIIHFLFMPDKVDAFTAEGRCVLNHSIQSSFVFELKGRAALPSLAIENDGKILLKPTFVGLSTDKILEIYNPTNIDLIVELKISNTYKRQIKIVQPIFPIKAREKVTKTIIFSPSTNSKFIFPVQCRVFFDKSHKVNINGLDYLCYSSQNRIHVSSKCDSNLSFIGDGILGGIRTSTSSLNFNYVLLGTSKKLSLTIFNDNSCPVIIKLLSLETNDSGSCVSKVFSTSVTDLVLTERSQSHVDVQFLPHTETFSECSLYLILPSAPTDFASLDPASLENFVSSGKCIRVLLNGNGVLPHLGITDAWCEKFSKFDLWTFFALDDLNRKCQESDNSSNNIKYDVLFEEMVKNLQRFQFNFGSRELDSSTTEVFLNFENVGHIPLEFEFEFPRDFLSSLDKWADVRLLETEFHRRQENILYNKLFSISPKRAKLPPKQQITVTFSYSHLLADSHSIPVLFTIINGMSCVLDLKGRTFSLDKNNKELEFKSFEFDLEPVDIGLSCSPLQYITLRNPCSISVQYVVDISPLQDLKKENYDMEILNLENSYGNIEPFSYTLLKFSFTPIEAKIYEVELPIRLINGANYSITLRGRGIVKQEEQQTLKGDPSVPKLPIIQKMLGLPKQLISLSLCDVNVGKLPCLTSVQRMIIVRNASSTDSISFIFNSQLPDHSKLVTSTIDFKPSSAHLKPKEYAVCLLELVTGQVPQILDSDITIAITNETEKAERERIRKEYEKKIISKQSITTSVEKKTNRTSLIDRSASISKILDRPTTASDFWKQNEYYTNVTNYLPTNYFIKLRGEVVDVERFKKLSSDLPQQFDWNSFYFRLIREYEAKMHLDDFKNSMSKSTNIRSTIKQTVKQIEMDQGLVQDVCMQLLQDLVSDSEIGHALAVEQNRETRIPYFAELVETPRSVISPDSTNVVDVRATVKSNEELVQELPVVGTTEEEKLRQYNQLMTQSNQPSSSQETATVSSSDLIATKEDVMKSVEFQNVTQAVLQTLCYDICREALQNEWSMVEQITRSNMKLSTK